MWWNPFYNTQITSDGILIVNQFTSQQKFQIKAPNASKFMESVIEPLLDEKMDAEAFLKQFPMRIRENLQNLINQLDSIILAEKKQQIFYQHLFSIIERVRAEFPGLDINRIVAYMEDMIQSADAIVLYDNDQYKKEDINRILPFKNIDAIATCGIDKYDLKNKISKMHEKDWIVFILDNLDNDVIDEIESEIVNNNRLVLFSQNTFGNDRVLFGPILLPRCTGGLRQFFNNKYYEKTVSLNDDLVMDSEEKVKNEMLSDYMYDEILKFTIDKYSNYATEYSKLLGTQYQIDYEEQNIKRREFIISEDWI